LIEGIDKKNELIYSEEFDTSPVVAINNVSVSNKYPEKGENVVVSYEIETIKGLGNIFLGGEGLFLTKLVGPGKVIIQSQNFGDFAGRIISLMPSR